MQVNHVLQHPDFDPSNESLPGDLAVLSLAESANIDDPEAPINAICLPPSPDTRYWENPSCVMSGFGLNEGTDYPTCTAHGALIASSFNSSPILTFHISCASLFFS